MIARYAPADMAALFSDTARFSLWLEVELLATEAQAALGNVPADEAATSAGTMPSAACASVASSSTSSQSEKRAVSLKSAAMSAGA